MNEFIETKYNDCLTANGITSYDIMEHLPTLKKYASECDHVTEFGVRWMVSTWALLAGYPKHMISYDINKPPNNLDEIYDKVPNFKFIQANVLDIEIEETDLLFIDTLHVYEQLKQEFNLHSNKAKKYIILHDTTTFSKNGEGGGVGLEPAISEFLETNHNWKIKEVFHNNNGLTILERV